MNGEDPEQPEPGWWARLEEKPAAGWVAMLVAAGVLFGLVLVAMGDVYTDLFGFVIAFCCGVYGAVYFAWRHWERTRQPYNYVVDPTTVETTELDRVRFVQRTLLIPLAALVGIWVVVTVVRAIFGLWPWATSESGMEWVIALTIALVVYVFVVRRRERAALANAVAHGGAGGARNATYGYFRRRDRIWQVVAVVVGLIVLWLVLFGDDDTSASATDTEEAAPTTETISSPLSFGDSGPDVVILQESLAAEGLAVTADGVYGPETADAVLAFQEQEQLTVDGVVGSETAEALGISSG